MDIGLDRLFLAFFLIVEPEGELVGDDFGFADFEIFFIIIDFGLAFFLDDVAGGEGGTFPDDFLCDKLHPRNLLGS